jgi:NADPH-dependent curcumin reductase CurA
MPRQIILASRPSGWPTADNFALTEADRADLADGQVRVRNLFMSVDPYMRVMLNNHGRVAMCGAIANYNATEPPAGPSNLGLVVSKRLTLRGFIIIDHQDRMPGMVTDVSGWLREGKIAHAETIVDGLDRAPGAFIDLLRGANTGKMLVRL